MKTWFTHMGPCQRWATLALLVTLAGLPQALGASAGAGSMISAQRSGLWGKAPSLHQVSLSRRQLHGGVDDHDEDAGAAAPSPDSSESDNVDVHSSTLIANKVGALVVFLAVPLIGCFLPRVLPIPPWLLNLAVLFSAGLFFSLAAEHLLGDSAAAFGVLVSDNPYPFAYMIFVSGYFLTWLADITARAVWERHAQLQEEKALIAGHEKKKGPSPASAGSPAKVECCKAGKADTTEGLEVPLSVGAEDHPVATCAGKGCKCTGESSSCKCAEPSWMEFDNAEAMAKTAQSSFYDLSLLEVLLLMLALCFHAVFEGLAVGLSSTVGDVWGTTLTVVLHKFLEGIALGTTLLAQKKDRSIFVFFLYALGFSIMAPLGIAIGIILDSTATSTGAMWVEAVGNALAAGVFVFVAVGHLMVKAMKPLPNDKWWTPFPKWGFAALGVIANSLLMLLAD